MSIKCKYCKRMIKRLVAVETTTVVSSFYYEPGLDPIFYWQDREIMDEPDQPAIFYCPDCGEELADNEEDAKLILRGEEHVSIL